MARVVIDAKVVGAEKLRVLGSALKDAGDKDLKRELFRAMGRSAKPLKIAARDGALQGLPHRGGLDERVAAGKFTSRTSITGKRAGLRITGAQVAESGQQMDLSAMDRGRLRHPTFGHRPWKTQTVKAGWFSDSLTIEADKVRDELLVAIDEIAAKLEAKA